MQKKNVDSLEQLKLVYPDISLRIDTLYSERVREKMSRMTMGKAPTLNHKARKEGAPNFHGNDMHANQSSSPRCSKRLESASTTMMTSPGELPGYACKCAKTPTLERTFLNTFAGLPEPKSIS